MHLFISAGEPSGDQHGGGLIEAVRRVRPDVRVSGLGGPQMHAAGQDQTFRLTDLAVMGVAAVVPALRKFHAVYRQAARQIRQDRPDAVVLIDFPGFHWHLARAARKAGVPVLWYMPPQLWAWAPWRIRKARRSVDAVLSGLPFEADWYAARGIPVDPIPHPFFDEVASHRLDAEFVRSIAPCGAGDRLVAILPGSRGGEVSRNFPTQLIAMRHVAEAHPGVRFEVACYREDQAEACRRMLVEACSQAGPMPCDTPVRFRVGRTSEILEAAEAALMVSGSVSLEVLARRVPAVVCYRGTPLMWAVGKTLLTVDHVSLPNLIAGREVMPEFPFMTRKRRNAAKMARVLNRWLSNDGELAAVRDQMDALAGEVDIPGGADRAAEAVIGRITSARSAAPGRRAA